MTKRKTAWRRRDLALAISIAGVVGADIGDDEQLIVNGEIEMIIEDRRARSPRRASQHDLFGLGVPVRRDAGHPDGRFRQPRLHLRRSGDRGVQHGDGVGRQQLRLLPQPVEDFEMTRATYPQWDEERGEVQTVEMQVIECQTERMGMEEPYRLRQPGHAQHVCADFLGSRAVRS
jgi:sulfur-oxidizing protein SoxA